jgi:hypothetical protein
MKFIINENVLIEISGELLSARPVESKGYHQDRAYEIGKGSVRVELACAVPIRDPSKQEDAVILFQEERKIAEENHKNYSAALDKANRLDWILENSPFFQSKGITRDTLKEFIMKKPYFWSHNKPEAVYEEIKKSQEFPV